MRNKVDSLKESKDRFVPRLRFPEFQNAAEWQMKTVGSSCEAFSGGTPSTSNNSFYGGTTPFIRSAEIARDKTELFLTETGLVNSSAKLIREGDVLVALYGANSGDVALAKISGAINQAILCLRHESNNIFLYQYLAQRQDWLVSSFVQGGQGNLSGDIIKSLRLLFPYPPEQHRIAECLTSIDDLIAADGRKLNALRNHKKGLLQQLFPAEGETIPRLRFPEFHNEPDWKEAALSSHVHLVSGLHLLPTDYGVTGEVPYFTGPTDFTNEEGCATKWTHKSQNTAADGDTLITVKGSGVGQLWYLTLPSVAIGRQLMAVRARQSSNRFLYQVLTTRSARFKALASGNLIPGLSRSDILNMKFHFPSVPEQEKVAACLSGMDVLIAAQSGRLANLKAHKKALMQQLFPVLDEVQA